MAKARRRGRKTEFPMTGPLRKFASEVSREIAADLGEPYFVETPVFGQNLVKTDHGNPVRS